MNPWWQLWASNQRWRDNLQRRAAHKALDIPPDDMNITTNKFGVGPLALVGTALVAGLTGPLAAYLLTRQQQAPPPAAPPAQQAPLPGPVEWEIKYKMGEDGRWLFQGADGVWRPQEP